MNGFLGTIILVTLLTAVVVAAIDDTELERHKDLITQCEEGLPRNQSCVLIAVKDEGNE